LRFSRFPKSKDTGLHGLEPAAPSHVVQTHVGPLGQEGFSSKGD
jgi:hypothetical protein